MTDTSALSGATSANARGGPTIEPLLVTVRTAATLLGISVPSVYREVGRGRLDMVKDGRSSKIIYASIKARAASLPRAAIKPAA